MSTLKLTDNFGLIIDAKPSVDSVFLKYLKSPDAIIGALRNPKPIKELLISDDPFESQAIGVAFTDPIKLGNAGVELTIDASLTGTITIIKGASLFSADTDDFREPILLPPNQAYLAAALTAELDITIADKLTDLQFGFAGGKTILITNYRLCAQTDPIVPALERLFTEFTLPGDLEDIAQLAEHDVLTLEGTGTLKLTAQANLLSSANPLATLNTGILPITLAEGAAVTVTAAFTLTGSYQLRIERLNGRKFRLGYQKKRTSEFGVAAQAGISINANAGAFDLIQSVLQAVSADPVPDKETFHQAGLTDDRISTIAAAIKTGIERSLALSVAGELDELDSSSTAFSYQIDADLLDDSGRQAVHQALDGDLTGIEQAHPGITPLKTIVETLRQGKHILKVNLLGIFNYGSVTTLFQKGTIIVDRETGDLTITDQAGASRIQFTADNFAQDTARLRRVLAESLLVTAAYRCSAALSAPQLSSHYWFFELQQKTNLQHITDDLTVAQALRLLSPSARNDRLTAIAGINAFGRSTFSIDASYTDELCKRMFLQDAQPRSEDEYQTIGRNALLLLLKPGGPINDARRLPLRDDAIWKAMTNGGQPSFPTLFASRGFDANQIADIADDYTLITWWATSMHDMGKSLAKMLQFVANNPTADRENNTFKKLRNDLDSAMATVVSNTQAQFGQPWGILAMDLAAGQQGDITLRLVSPGLTLAATQRNGPGAKNRAN